MSSRVNIGGATYSLSLEDRQFVRQLQAAERTSQQRAAAIRRQLAALPLGHPDVARFQRELQQAEAAARRSSQQIQDRLRQIGPESSRSARIMSSSFVQGFAGMVAASAGLSAITQQFKAIVTAGQDAINAQRALNVQFGAMPARELAGFTDQLAEATARGRTEAKQAAAITATLARNYGFTSQEIRTVIEVSNDLAAASGRGLADSVQRVTAALRGETESSEALGLSLQVAALKGSTSLTEAEKKRLEVMGNVEGAHVRLRVLLEQSAFAQGEAAKQALEGSNNFARLSAAIDNLQTSAGGATGPIAALAGELAGAAKQAEHLLAAMNAAGVGGLEAGERMRRFGAAAEEAGTFAAGLPGPLGLAGVAWQALGAGITDSVTSIDAFTDAVGTSSARIREMQLSAEAVRLAMGEIQGQTPGLVAGYVAQSGAVADLTTDLKALAEAEMQAAREERTRRTGFMQNVVNRGPAGPTRQERIEEAKSTADAIASANIAAITAQGERQAAADDAEIKAAERARDGRLRAAEQVRDGALAALEQEQDAAAAHFDALREQYDADKDARLKALEEAKEAALKGLAEEERAAEAAFKTRVRDHERERDRRLEEQETIRDAALEDVRGRQGVEAARRQVQDRALADTLRAEERARVDTRAAERDALQAGLADFERGQDVRRLAIAQTRDASLAAVEEEQAAEQRRHSAALDNLAREEDAATAALRRRLGILDAAEERESRARTQQSQQEQRREARSDLREARESDDPEAIARARKRVADLEADIRQAAIAQERQDERGRINERLAEIAQEFQARKDAEDATLAAALAALAQRQDAIRTHADTELAGLQARTEQEQASYAARTEAMAAHYAAQDRALEDTRLAHDRALEDARVATDRVFAERTETVNASYQNEQEEIRRTYDDPETGILPKLKQEQELSAEYFDGRRTDVQETYTAEVEQVAALYDGPGGLLKQLETAKKNSDAYFDSKRTGITTTYQSEIDLTKELYDGESGLIQKLKDVKVAHDEWMDKSIEDWTNWGKEATKSLDEANPRLAELLEKLEKLKGLGATVVGVAGTDAGQDDASIPAPPAGGLQNQMRLTRARGAGAAPSNVNQGGQTQVVDGHYFPLPNYSGNAPHATYHVPGATDLFMPRGTPIHAVFGGQVGFRSVDIGNGAANPGGNAITIHGDDGLDYYYAHMLEPPIPSGSRVAAGQVIGHVSDTGNAVGTGPHLHIGIGHGISSGAGAAAGAGQGFDAQSFLAGLLKGDLTGVEGIPAGGMVTEEFLLDLFGSQYRFGIEIAQAAGFTGDLSGAAAGSPPAAVAAYILAKAAQLGYVLPTAAVDTWRGEGSVTDSGQSNVPVQGGPNGREPSYGPFQLYYGGGEGNTFSARTDIWPGDAAFEQASIDYALERALTTGWTPWHGSPYYPNNPFYGITHMAQGGVIDRETVMVDRVSGKPWGLAGEGGRREYVVPEPRPISRISYAGALYGNSAGPEIVAPIGGGGGGDTHIWHLEGAFIPDRDAFKREIVHTLDRAQRDGSFRAVPRA